MPLVEKLKDGARRYYAAQNYDLPQLVKPYPHSVSQAWSHELYIGPGVVEVSEEPSNPYTIPKTAKWQGGYVNPSRLAGRSGNTGIVQGFIGDDGSLQARFVPEETATEFPIGSLPIFLARVDPKSELIQNVEDYRPR